MPVERLNDPAGASPPGAVVAAAPRKKRMPPLSLRLTVAERERLTREAAGAPLGPYIRAKALGGPPLRGRRSGVSVQDRQAMAKALALLGSSRLSGNISQLARLAHIRALPVSPGTGAELRAALADVRAIRRLLMTALAFAGRAGGRLPANNKWRAALGEDNNYVYAIAL